MYKILRTLNRPIEVGYISFVLKYTYVQIVLNLFLRSKDATIEARADEISAGIFRKQERLMRACIVYAPQVTK